MLLAFSTVGLASLADKTVDVTIDVNPYATLDVRQERLFVAPLLGKAGLYLSDGHRVREEALEYFTLTDDDVVNHEKSDSIGIVFRVRSNRAVNVEISSPFNDNGTWIESPSAFLVFNHFNPWVLRGIVHPGNRAVSIPHPASTEIEYKIGGAIHIEEIDQQSAGVYTTEIVVTVSE